MIPPLTVLGAKRRGLRHWLFVLVPLALGAGFILVAGRFVNLGERAIDVRLDSAKVLPNGTDNPPYRIAIGPILSPNRTAQNYELLAEFLEKRLSHPVRLIQQETHTQVNELLRNGSVQAALLCPGGFIRAEEEHLPIEAIAVPVYDEGPFYHALIVVRADSPLRKLEDLKGHSFAYTDSLSLAGYYYPLYHLLSLRLDPREFFSRTSFSHSSDGSLDAVIGRVVDGAAVHSRAYQREMQRNPSLHGVLRIIDTSPPLGSPPVVVPGSLDPELRDRLRSLFLEMHRIPRGRKALDAMGIQRFQAPTPTFYDTARAIHDRVDLYLEGKK